MDGGGGAWRPRRRTPLHFLWVVCTRGPGYLPIAQLEGSRLECGGEGGGECGGKDDGGEGSGGEIGRGGSGGG